MSLSIYLYSKDEEYPVFEGNITHNLGKMASYAGVYKVMWRSEENGIKRGDHLIEPLLNGLTKLKANPEFFKRFNPENGWGDYQGFLKFIEDYLNACVSYPDATITFYR